MVGHVDNNTQLAKSIIGFKVSRLILCPYKSLGGQNFRIRKLCFRQAGIKCADGVLRPKLFCEADIDEIYYIINIDLIGRV